MEHILIQVAYDCFHLGPFFLRQVFITQSNISNYSDNQTPTLRGRSSEIKMEPSVMCVCVCVFVCVCVWCVIKSELC